MRRSVVLVALCVNVFVLWSLVVVPYQTKQEAARLELADQRNSADVCRQVWVEDQFHFRPLMAACAHEVIENDLKAGKSIGDASRHAGKLCVVVLDSCTKGLVK